MSSEFLKIDKFLLGKGFYKNTIGYKKGTAWVHYWKENKKIRVEFVVADDDSIRLRLYSKTAKTADYCWDLESEWCYLVHLMELLGM